MPSLPLRRLHNPSGKLWCDSCGLAHNLILASTDAAKAAGKVTPELNKKHIGMVFYVSIPNISAVELTYLL
jgi:glyceraldehyde-3-phosphate dehydrogenase/erythrose-4-phosphate dehydrogenase